MIAEVFRGKNRFFTYKIRDIGISFQAEVTEGGDCLIHWELACDSRMRYIVDAETFDDMMTTRVSQARAFLEKRVDIVGPLGDAIMFMKVVTYPSESTYKGKGRNGKTLRR